jgi:DNA repair protein RadA/Sms
MLRKVRWLSFSSRKSPSSALQSFVCNECGSNHSKWVGQCTACKSWNSVVKFAQSSSASNAKVGGNIGATLTSANSKQSGRKGSWIHQDSSMLQLNQVLKMDSQAQSQHLSQRLSLRTKHDAGLSLKQIFGEGIVPGSVTLLGGDPGIGKSTFALQLSQALSMNHQSAGTVLYVSGEETINQVSLRAKRLFGENGISDNLLVVGESCVERIIDYVIHWDQEQGLKRCKPIAIVLDSIQTMFSEEVEGAPGTVVQVRNCSIKLLRMAKDLNVALFLLGHVTKSGEIAGPRVLEHLVDTVLYLEGDRFSTHRILRCFKNRFGDSTDVAVMDLTDQGLKEVENPSSLFLSNGREVAPGFAVGCAMEGSRPILVEIQALVAKSHAELAPPRHRGLGLDNDRLFMLIAILQKLVKLPAGSSNIYVNVVGGLRVKEPIGDLAILTAMMSSYKNVAVPEKTLLVGEVGLTGELRPVPHVKRVINEARRMGFKKCIVPEGALKNQSKLEQSSSAGIVVPCTTLIQALKEVQLLR